MEFQSDATPDLGPWTWGVYQPRCNNPYLTYNPGRYERKKKIYIHLEAKSEKEKNECFRVRYINIVCTGNQGKTRSKRCVHNVVI